MACSLALPYLCAMPVSIEQRGKKSMVITVEGDLDQEHLQQAIRHLRFLSITRKFKKVSQGVADKLADEITAAASSKRKRRMAS